ncbi:glycerophosphodiester phosphodiesterase family protein [Labedella endophytica]|uniref:glycerophosphodiester phosphodiesterase n=1 Tax=Labedella endophytica TaxID=1523160 RepID=A0A3S0X911_9MICO|nr:glycerophosphodiester phosphodiesterase family protein [Labedella endophytica]RUQ98945.1 glycerophosphodiester phosphodiesterase [Labedella endophytica]
MASEARPRPLVIGHRGAPGYRPEHSRSGYELAFALGADSVEPDVVASKDGILVVRHENEISGTTDVASRAEFAHLRATKTIDGDEHTGWFTEDFTWEELSTLRVRERLPMIRPSSASFDGKQGILRLADLAVLVDAASEQQGRPLGMTVEIKHATHFDALGLPLDELVATELDDAGWGSGRPLIVESFEKTVLAGVSARGLEAEFVYLVERSGAAADVVARDGASAITYAEELSDGGLDALAVLVDGVSADKTLVLSLDEDGVATGATDLVSRLHARGLTAYAWTLRPENRFLSAGFRRGPADAFGDWASEFAVILGTGIDGVFLDHPDLGVAARDALDDRAGVRRGPDGDGVGGRR